MRQCSLAPASTLSSATFVAHTRCLLRSVSLNKLFFLRHNLLALRSEASVMSRTKVAASSTVSCLTGQSKNANQMHRVLSRTAEPPGHNSPRTDLLGLIP